MKKIVYLLPTVAALALAGCGDDTAADTDSGDETSTSGSPTGDPSTETMTDPTVDPGTTTTGDTDSDPTIDPDTGSESSSDDGGPACDADDECTPETVVEDCGEFFACIGCLCVEDGDPPICPDGWNNEGTYGDCGNGEECGGGDLNAACAGGPSDSSVCLYLGCNELCDCPAPPEGFEDLVRCEDQFGPGGMLDDINDCFLDCSGGAECPEGMVCFGDVCYNGEEPKPAAGYGDCVNNAGCPNANEGCITDADPPNLGFCTSGCNSPDDCNAAPDTGDAPIVCEDLTGDDMGECYLDCSMGQTCPDGMVCGFNLFCAWEPLPEPGFADCATQPDLVCQDGEACVETTDMTNGTTQICAGGGCVDPTMDCPDVPVTGDAPAACQNIDGMAGDECVLDCSGGQTCPDGAVCTDDGFCSYELPTFTFQEDFQGGSIPMGWTLWDVDGLAVNMNVDFVTDAWVATDVVTGMGDFWAAAASWYSPAGASDDWMISPAITLGATANMSWSAFSANAGFPDGYEVYVVPTTVTEFTDFIADGDPTAFLALDPMDVPSAAPVFAVVAEEGEIQNRSVNFDDLGGQEVHFAFRSTAFDGVLILIDNISIYE